MSVELVKNLLKQREKTRLEFKEAKNSIPRNLFETVCAFLNREGGSILLGVNDNGVVEGVNPSSVDQITAEISSLSNNPTKLDPPYILFPKVTEINSNKVIHVQVPASSQVHRCNGFVYDRSSDGDFKITRPETIAEIYNRKKTHFTEGTIYPYVKESDFNLALLSKVRNLIHSNNPNHPWLELSDQELFKTSGLYKFDYQNGKEGFTLAAVLLLGKDHVIKNILPHYKIDALVRIQNPNRYDDRLIIETNLIDAYSQLMEFTAKHLPDKFFLENDTRISLREKIFREVIANLVVHREYTNAHSATFSIYKDIVEIKNANNPNGSGPIKLNNFTTFQKNPIIFKFFVQLGRVDELGSGIINVHKYLKHFSPGAKPAFIEDNLFITKIPVKVTSRESKKEPELSFNALNDAISDGINDGISDGINDGINDGIKNLTKTRLHNILLIIAKKEGIKSKEIAESIGISIPALERYIRKLRSLNTIQFKGSKKYGGYYLTEEFKKKYTEKL